MSFKVYEKRFKLTVPQFPPAYFKKAVDCYLSKVHITGKVGYICKDTDNCALGWLCDKLAYVILDCQEKLAR